MFFISTNKQNIEQVLQIRLNRHVQTCVRCLGFRRTQLYVFISRSSNSEQFQKQAYAFFDYKFRESHCKITVKNFKIGKASSFQPAAVLKINIAASNFRGFCLQSGRGDLLKKCSEDIWVILRKTSLRSCNANKITKQLYLNNIYLFRFLWELPQHLQDMFSTQYRQKAAFHSRTTDKIEFRHKCLIRCFSWWNRKNV